MGGNLQQLWHDAAEGFILGLTILLCTDSLGHCRQQQPHQILLVAATHRNGLGAPLQAAVCHMTADCVCLMVRP